MTTDGNLRYFGCLKGRSGHFWCDPDGNNIISYTDYLPAKWCAPHIDSGFAPRTATGEAKEGVGRVTLLRGWSVLAWWDRSQDSRPGSNSALVAHGRFSFDEMVAMGLESYPWVFARLRVNLREEEG